MSGSHHLLICLPGERSLPKLHQRQVKLRLLIILSLMKTGIWPTSRVMVMPKFQSHPESNGQSEATNSTILDLLRCYTIDRPSNWDQHLPLLQFTYNTTPHSTTGRAPFEIVYGRKLPLPISTMTTNIPVADSSAADHVQILKDVTLNIQQSQIRYAKQTNKRRQKMELT